jgi:hypothetical protein
MPHSSFKLHRQDLQLQTSHAFTHVHTPHPEQAQSLSGAAELGKVNPTWASHGIRAENGKHLPSLTFVSM